jgi:hypothetical protein
MFHYFVSFVYVLVPQATKCIHVTGIKGPAIAQAVSCRLLTAEARVRVQVSLWWTKQQWDRLLSEYSVFPCQCHSIATQYSLMYHLGDGQRAR